MSSTYRVLCLSHNPATVAGEYNTAEAAEAAIAEGLPQHPHCDLMIGRYSYPLIELGCPPSQHDRTGQRCHHSITVWTETRWLRLLVLASEATEPALREAAERARQACLTQERLSRITEDLGS